jgi:2-C-methyl-D-erythritol 4-phosphate cytidylyltransferase
VTDARSPGHLPRDATPPPLRDVDARGGDVGVVIVAGGTSSRAGATQGELKQFRWVGDRPMLLHAVQAFQRRPDVALVVCVLPRAFAGDPPPWLFQCDIDRLLVSTGGTTRGESVWNGLEDLPPELEIAVIHDAARPLVTDDTIEAVIAEARKGHGAIAALPVVDTLKAVDTDGRITSTVDRTGLWRAQTPQAFPLRMIEHAYVEARRANFAATDDAALCERLGFQVTVVRGSERAMKITEPADFARAERLIGLAD